MRADIIRIDMSMDLVTGDVVTIAKFKLPDGSEVDAQIDPAIADIIMAASSTSGSTLKVETKKPVNGHVTPAQELEAEIQSWAEDPGVMAPEEPETTETVRWAELPDTELSPMMKQIFTTSGVPDEIPAEDLSNLIGEVIEQLRAQEVLKEPPKQAQVIVREGAVYAAPKAPRRTVPRDDAGNPIVSGMDPGEIVGDPDDADEDGVGQI